MGELHQQNKPDQDRICQKAMKKADDCAKKYKGSIIWPNTGCDPPCAENRIWRTGR